jgi:hypothetical protein
VGNPILAKRDGPDSAPYGVSIDLAKQLGKELDVEVELVVFDAAGKSVEAVSTKKADFGFFAVDPVRGQEIFFTSPYIVIEGAYMVRSNSPLTDNEQVDKPGNRIVVGKGSAYDLYLTREIRQAQLIHAPTSPLVVNVFLENNYEVAAGVKQQLEADALKNPNCTPFARSIYGDSTSDGCSQNHLHWYPSFYVRLRCPYEAALALSRSPWFVIKLKALFLRHWIKRPIPLRASLISKGYAQWFL